MQRSRKVSRMTRYALSTALGVIAISGAAHAEDAGGASTSAAPAHSDSNRVEDPIVVTGSRIVRDGSKAPTPVTVIDAHQLEARGQTNVGEALNDLPSFRALQAPATQQAQGGNVGARILDLRALGSARTLVLLDGKRFVPSTLQGTIDVNLMPTMLIERTEVVTGGASAAYGSDAVAGVVNFIINKHLDGLRATVEGGISQKGDYREVDLGVAYGTGFAGGRGHIEVSVEYNKNDGIGDCYQRPDWCPMEQLLSNTPAGSDGLPANMRVGPNSLGNQAIGGLINVPTGPLHGITFNADGTPRPFVYGHIYGTNPSPLLMLGGEGSTAQGFVVGINLSPPVERLTSFVHGEYDVSDSVKASVDLSYGDVKGTVIGSAGRITDAVIQRDNAYLPAAVASIMDANSISSFTLGRFFTDRGGSIDHSDNKTYRAVFSLEGQLGGSWGWDAYYQYGRNDFKQVYTGNMIVGRLRNALDAVNSGGSVQCRINVDGDPNNNDSSCVPLNIFGPGNVSDAAWNYVAQNGYQTAKSTENVAAANIHGDVFNLPGGAFAIAAGGEFRSDKIVGTADPFSSTNQFWSFNAKAVSGKIDVAEGYVEAVAPLLSDVPLAHTLELNGAARRTHYTRSSPGTTSSSLSVTTWKFGAVYEPIEGLRFRGTRSRDIRAPNLNELFGPVTSGRVSIIDPAKSGLLVEAQAFSGANPVLEPEQADTWTAGVVVSPNFSFLHNFKLSVDYFDISMKGAIATLGSQTIVNRCFSGATEFCPYVTRDGNGFVTEVRDVLNNVNRQKVRGYDIEASYHTQLPGSSTLDLRLLATRYLELSITDSVGTVDRAGQTGYRGGATPGVPSWIVDGNALWTIGKFQLGAHGHFIPRGTFDVLLVGPEDPGYSVTLPNSVNTNRIDSRFYLDLSASVQVLPNVEVFGVINNVFDKDPPLAFSSQGGTNEVWFDQIGRYFKLGARVKM